MWGKFEWENKVQITPVEDYESLEIFVESLSEKLNMGLISPLDGSSGFLAANLYAKSKF